MSDKHLSLEERHYIELSLKNERTISEIVTYLGRLQEKLLAIKESEAITIPEEATYDKLFELTKRIKSTHSYFGRKTHKFLCLF